LEDCKEKETEKSLEKTDVDEEDAVDGSDRRGGETGGQWGDAALKKKNLAGEERHSLGREERNSRRTCAFNHSQQNRSVNSVSERQLLDALGEYNGTITLENERGTNAVGPSRTSGQTKDYDSTGCLETRKNITWGKTKAKIGIRTVRVKDETKATTKGRVPKLGSRMGTRRSEGNGGAHYVGRFGT